MPRSTIPSTSSAISSPGRRFGSSDQKQRRNGAARPTRHDDSPRASRISARMPQLDSAPKMHGLATAAGSASIIRELCRLARCEKGRVYLVDAPTAEHGRRRLAAFRAGDKPDIGAPPMMTVLDNGRVVGIGTDACLALAGASKAIRHWDTHGCAERRPGKGAGHRRPRSALRRHPAEPARQLRRSSLLAPQPLSAEAGGGSGVPAPCR